MEHEVLIPPVPLTLLDGRSITLRLSRGAWMRTILATGVEMEEISTLSKSKQMGFESRLIYESSELRREMDFDSFIDIMPMIVSKTTKELMERYGPKNNINNAPSPNPESASTGSENGQLGATTLD